jgi:hypothetical protein
LEDPNAGTVHGGDGDIMIFPRSSDIFDNDQATIKLDGGNGNFRLGGNGQDGDISVRDNDNRTVFQFNGNRANLRIGGGSHIDDPNESLVHGGDGDIMLFPRWSDISDAGQATIRLDGGNGNIQLGGNGQDGDLFVKDSSGEVTVEIQGNEGDICLRNADCAEEFDVYDYAAVDPGSVMVLYKGGKICKSSRPYDKKVAGVISGAGQYKPAIVLDKKTGKDNRMPLALMGKVICKVDASYGPIEVGDLLTTSATAGHAMKASDREKAFGSILGKALSDWKDGVGEIPILVSLQ